MLARQSDVNLKYVFVFYVFVSSHVICFCLAQLADDDGRWNSGQSNVNLKQEITAPPPCLDANYSHMRTNLDTTHISNPLL